MKQQLEGFSEFANQIFEEWQVPGAAIAIVQSNDIVFLEGFGKRDVNNSLPVTPETIFPIGSITKSFSAAVLGLLVDEGKLSWDQRVKDILPSFQLHDSFATERMTIIDLLTHRSGLPGHDFTWIGSKKSRQELFDTLVNLEPTKDFRTYFQYSNLMYMITALVVQAIVGESWETFIQERLFSPLKLNSTSVSVRDVTQQTNYSLPYKQMRSSIKELPFGKTDTDTSPIAPAGAINSNVLDIAQWMQFHLGNGQQGILSNDSRLLQQSPQMIIASMPAFDFIWQQPEIGDVTYGLGWFLYPYQGHKVIEHGGNVSGFSAIVSMMPDLDVGVVILTNLEGRPLNLATSVLVYNIFDRLLGLDLVDWQSRNYGVVQNIQAYFAQETEKQEAERKPTPPNLNLNDYLGKYHHPAYGSVTVIERDNQLQAQINGMEGVLDYLDIDEFRLRNEQFELGLAVYFGRSSQTEVESITIPLEPTAKPITFTR